MNWFDRAETVLVIVIALLFWLYIASLIILPISYLLGVAWLASILEPFVKTIIIYFFVSAYLLLFWPTES